jgi:serine/threonine-protein kinase
MGVDVGVETDPGTAPSPGAARGTLVQRRGATRTTARLTALHPPPAPSPSTTQARDGALDERRFVLALGAIWLLGALVVDPLVIARADAALVVGLRVLGAGVLALGAYAVWRGRSSARGAWIVLGALGAALSAVAGAIAAVAATAGVAAWPAPVGATPLFALVALAATASPPWRVGVPLAAAWLAAHTSALALGAWVDDDVAAALSDGRAARGVLATFVVQLGAVVFIVIGAHRAWRLRHELFESRRLGHYRLMSPLGVGMNEVWLAWDEQRRREVALKLLRTPGCAEVTRARFEREAELVRALRSSHTTRIYDYGVTDDGYAYISFEYLRGLDLDALVHAFGPLDVGRAHHMMVQVCRGVGVAHAAGVVHRDVKPANLHCSDQAGAEDHTRILDFGVARRVGLSDVTLDGTVVGTPAYMSPEAFDGADLTPQSDVYSIGATFYFALTGVPPFDGASFDELRGAHTRAPVVPPSLRIATDVPRAFERVILRCLAKSPADRYPDALALGAALEACARDVPAWSREDASRWWHRARVGRMPVVATNRERTTEVEVVPLRRPPERTGPIEATSPPG